MGFSRNLLTKQGFFDIVMRSLRPSLGAYMGGFGDRRRVGTVANFSHNRQGYGTSYTPERLNVLVRSEFAHSITIDCCDTVFFVSCACK